MKTTATDSGNVKKWRFFRAGGFDQVRLDSGEDLVGLDRLDRKLWVALACPVDNVNFDKRTLSLIDGDGDRRIRAEELVAAVQWTAARLRDPDLLLRSADGLSPDAIPDTTDDGKKLVAACRSALLALGKSDTGTLTVADSEKIDQLLSQHKFNGDGIITEDSAENDAVRSVIADIIATIGSKTDRSGKPGIDAESIETFYCQATAYAAWHSEPENDGTIAPLGADTETAATALQTVRAKIDDFFARCAIAEFDERMLPLLDNADHLAGVMGASVISDADSRCETLPLARIRPQSLLPLVRGCNPAWTGRITAFTLSVVEPLLGCRETLSEADWLSVKKRFDPWINWQKRNPDPRFDTLGPERVKLLLATGGSGELVSLVNKDRAESSTFESLTDLERLVRFTRDLYQLCINFVNFKEFYSGKNSAIFQAGTLFLDQRSCLLCIKIDDVNKHSTMAAMAGACLVYCDCRRQNGAEKLTIVAAFTNGDSENLINGRNGVFYDREGKDWDATIIKIIENPISLRQAFWLPYKNLVRMIESQVAKRASAADSSSTTLLEKTAVNVATPDKNKSPAPQKSIDIGTVAALGVAAGALGTFLATLMGYTTGIIRLGPFAIAGAIAGVLLLISGPSLILASIKLRKRNLGPILDAGGWAINAKARINIPFGAALTGCATLPPGSQRDLFDPYAEKKSAWPKIVIAVFCLWAAWLVIDKSGVGSQWMKHIPSVKQQIIGLFHGNK